MSGFLSTKDRRSNFLWSEYLDDRFSRCIQVNAAFSLLHRERILGEVQQSPVLHTVAIEKIILSQALMHKDVQM